MTTKVSTLIVAIGIAIILGGCGKEPPKCSDETTASLVRKIVLDQIGGSEGLTEKEIKDNLRIEFPRASAFDEKIKKYSCEARLVAGDAYQLPIVYESQLDDKDQHIVAVGGIGRRDLLGVQGGMIEGIKKSRGGSAQGISNQSANPPSFNEGKPYSEVRTEMLKDGWTPLKLPDADSCGEFDDRCKNRPEMEACSGSGLAPCKFAWKKEEKITKICTVGEDAAFSAYCQ